MLDKLCAECGKEFTPKSGRATVCSVECRMIKNNRNSANCRARNPERRQQIVRKHAKSEARKNWRINNRELVNSTTAAWRERNKGFWDEYMYAWRTTHREHKRSYDAARRSRCVLSPEDRIIATEYRKAIANDPCFYCDEKTEEMHDEHFFPLAKGGTNHWWNLVRACSKCNLSKHARCGTWFILRAGI